MELETAGWARQTSQEALERYAEEVFDPHHIASRIYRACKSSHPLTHISQERPVDLSGTQAAQRITQLLKSHGYDVSWEDACQVEATRREQAREYHYREMVIQWVPRALER